MSKLLFESITQDQLLNAAKYIDEHEVPLERTSREYDAWVNGHPYPPPYLLAIINKELGGDLINPSDFPNSSKQPFTILENAGAIVVPKWVNLFKEIAKKLSTYDHSSSHELADILKQTGISIGVDDQDDVGNKIALEEIDPFSFICLFNKYGDKQRSEFLNELKKAWALKAMVPKEYPGVPTANAMRAWLFSYKDQRKPNDVPLLWKLFNQLMNGKIENDTFNKALEIKNTKHAKLTEVLFDFDPFNYLPINKQTIPYLKEKGISIKFKDFQGYKEILRQVRETFNENFPILSRNAWLSKDKRQVSYFLFKCNPDKWDLIKYLKEDLVDDWAVNKLHDQINIGDKVILYKTGESEGVYALAEITSEIEKRNMNEEAERGEWQDDSYKKMPDKVDIEITHNLANNFIPLSKLQGKINRPPQGTNFKATKEQYDLILDLIRRDNLDKYKERRYFKCATGENSEFWLDFQTNNKIAIGWDDLGNHGNYKDNYEFANALGVSTASNASQSLNLFSNECKINDIVFAADGKNKVLDVGIIESPVIFDDTLVRNKNIRQVRWLGLEPMNLKPLAHEIGYKNIFRFDVFTTVNPFGFIFKKYVEAHPEYAEVFDKYNMPYLIEEESEKEPYRYNNPNIILYGPPGTGKTYSTIDLAVKIANGTDEGHINNKYTFDALRDQGQVEFITFHQNYAYEDFVVGMRPDTDQETLRFKPHKGIFYQICLKARENFESGVTGRGKKRAFEEVFQELINPLEKEKEVSIAMKSGKTFWITDVTDRTIFFRKPNGNTSHSLSISTLQEMVNGTRDMVSGLTAYYTPLIELIREKRESQGKPETIKKFVLIIDEINRGNISRIFGELITLLEEDKRLGQENELKVTLPNGEKGFSVPPNLYLLGTMNTADKSIALLDIALRRRFEFIGKYPEYDKLTPMVQEKLTKLNASISEAKKSPDFMIGHAYFINKPDDEFSDIMNKKIIPLLYEYFNGRDEFVKGILDQAEIEVKMNPNSLSWEAQEL